MSSPIISAIHLNSHPCPQLNELSPLSFNSKSFLLNSTFLYSWLRAILSPSLSLLYWFDMVSFLIWIPILPVTRTLYTPVGVSKTPPEVSSSGTSDYSIPSYSILLYFFYVSRWGPVMCHFPHHEHPKSRSLFDVNPTLTVSSIDTKEGNIHRGLRNRPDALTRT